MAAAGADVGEQAGTRGVRQALQILKEEHSETWWSPCSQFRRSVMGAALAGPRSWLLVHSPAPGTTISFCQ